MSIEYEYVGRVCVMYKSVMGVAGVEEKNVW
jgi:hypothetical protein